MPFSLLLSEAVTFLGSKQNYTVFFFFFKLLLAFYIISYKQSTTTVVTNPNRKCIKESNDPEKYIYIFTLGETFLEKLDVYILNHSVFVCVCVHVRACVCVYKLYVFVCVCVYAFVHVCMGE